LGRFGTWVKSLKINTNQYDATHILTETNSFGFLLWCNYVVLAAIPAVERLPARYLPGAIQTDVAGQFTNCPGDS
jgi:hypothetical protein